MSSPAQKTWSDFSVTEWHRLSDLATKYEPKMRLAYTRAAKSGTKIDTLQLRKTIIDIVAETGISSAQTYGLVFNPNSVIYKDTVEGLVESYVKTITPEKAKLAVQQILPQGLSLEERRNRLNTFGLDSQSAVRIERYRQERGDTKTALADVDRARRAAVIERGNLIALTEVNRAINSALESLWIDNTKVSKADVYLIDRTDATIGTLPRTAKKEIVTRRDGKVCNYCISLEGSTALIGRKFHTEYGLFDGPPFHPRCRCFMIASM